MMPLSGFQIYLCPRMTLNFDLLTPNVERLMSLSHTYTTCAHWHQNWSDVPNYRIKMNGCMDGRTYIQVENIRSLPACQTWSKAG